MGGSQHKHTKFKWGPQWVALLQTHEFTSGTKSQIGYRQKGAKRVIKCARKEQISPSKTINGFLG